MKRELFAMKLYAGTGRTLRSATVQFRAPLPISEQRRAGPQFAARAQPLVYISSAETRNFNCAVKPRKERALTPVGERLGALNCAVRHCSAGRTSLCRVAYRLHYTSGCGGRDRWVLCGRMSDTHYACC